MFGAIAGGIASALAGGAMSKLFGGGQKAASGGIQGDVLATDNNTVGMGDAGIKSAIQGSNVPNPDEAVPSFVLVLWLKLVKDFLKVRCRLALLPFLISWLIWLDLVASLPLIKERILVIILLLHVLSLFFFFQAEDGIRDTSVTGVQTCALPISPVDACRTLFGRSKRSRLYCRILRTIIILERLERPNKVLQASTGACFGV